MGLLDFLKSGENKANGCDRASDSPSAVEYVEWLTKFMLRSSRTELTLDTSAPLPGAGETGENAPPCEPEPAVVINRLKLVSGLNPIRLSAPATGSFEEKRSSHVLVVSTRFEDREDRSTCKLQIRVRARSA